QRGARYFVICLPSRPAPKPHRWAWQAEFIRWRQIGSARCNPDAKFPHRTERPCPMEPMTASDIGEPYRSVFARINVRTASHLGIDVASKQQSFDLIFPER